LEDLDRRLEPLTCPLLFLLALVVEPPKYAKIHSLRLFLIGIVVAELLFDVFVESFSPNARRPFLDQHVKLCQMPMSVFAEERIEPHDAVRKRR